MGIRRFQDRYAVLAKQRGYPARSIYKLKEILAQHKIFALSKDDRVLDLGAAPGSFSLYFAEQCKVSVVACDIKKLEVSHSKIFPIYGDFTDCMIVDQIVKQSPFQLVISDAAPSTMGFKLTDHARSLELVEQAWCIAQSVLMSGGNFIAKFLGGGGSHDHQEFLQKLRKFFTKIKLFRPQATRSESGEVYLLASNYIKEEQQ